MERFRNAILDRFDIKHLKSRCNHPSCLSRPEKEVFIYKYTTTRKIGIATLYVCATHVFDAKAIVKKIKSLSPSSIIQSRIGTVAQN
ncbi:MAG: hypothetical protein HYT72_05690 [Candidatus Aenigmarchaeota archaeon]|nr:hypothetical protein [Candidatus Aenigmarchaeota archaeon]